MYIAKVSHIKDYTFKLIANNEEFFIDAKIKGKGPLDILLAGLSSCVGVYIRRYADSVKIKLEEFSVTASAELSKEPPYCFREINIELDLKGVEIDERRKKALLDFLKNCPAHNTLKNNPDINFNLAKG